MHESWLRSRMPSANLIIIVIEWTMGSWFVTFTKEIMHATKLGKKATLEAISCHTCDNYNLANS